MSKSDFKYDEQGRIILGSAEEMAAWVKLGFEEQDKRRNPDIPFYQNYIDLRKCDLYTSKTSSSPIFNFYELAGVVPGIVKIEDDPNYLYEVKLDIFLDGSILRGNFFHYVKFDGKVVMDEVVVDNTFSCFRCLFDGFVYMQGIHLKRGYTFEQCVFNKGLVMTSAVIGGINAEFNHCILKDRISLTGTSFAKTKDYPQSINLSNSTVENLNISKVKTDGIPLYIQNSSINGMKMNNMAMDGIIDFNSCTLDGIITSVIDEGQPNNVLKELKYHNCQVKAQYHIENSEIENISFAFGKIGSSGRLRLYGCNIGELFIGSSSVFGQMDIIGNSIESLDLKGSCVPGYLLYQNNKVKEFADRQTLSLLKNEAKKVNDEVSVMQLYAKEMNLLLSDKGVSFWDKVSLWFNKAFSNFGGSWTRALRVTLILSVVLTSLMLGVGSGKYGFDPTGEFIGIGPFTTILLDSVNVFSVPLFRETIEAYDLNVLGQVLYFVIKLVVTYGAYQFVVAFRKYGRR